MRQIIIRIANWITRKLQSKPTYIQITNVTNYNLLENLNCVITGGGRGLGLAIAKKIISGGGRVIITGRNKDVLEKACNELGKNTQYIVFDSLDIDKYNIFFNNIITMMPSFNAMVLNAGISLHERSFESVNKVGFQKQLDTNLKAAYFMAQEFVKRVNNKGNLLFISSETGAMKCVLPYGLSKAMIDSLIPALNAKYYTKGIRVNAIAPGSTITNMVKNSNADTDDYYYRNAAERYFLPEEVAEVASFLLSDASLCIGGEIIHTNAGNHFRVQ